MAIAIKELRKPGAVSDFRIYKYKQIFFPQREQWVCKKSKTSASYVIGIHPWKKKILHKI
jgi:hypothetical protein